MDNVTRLLMKGAAGGGDKTYIDDVFSTLIFKGNNSYPRTVTNGINFSEEGGLLIGKNRINAYGWVAWDTVRGAGDKALRIDSNQAENGGAVGPYVKLDQFNTDGFRLNQPSSQDVFNANNEESVFWSFRKTKGFLDIVEFTGNGTSSQVIPHNLGSVPGCIILKSKNTADNWKVYHRGLNGGVTPEKWMVKLNDIQAAHEYTEWWNDTAPTATNFTVGEWNNESGWDFIAYVFAHDDQQFGENGNQSIIKCGYYTGTGSPDLNVNLGFEPQFLMIKNDDRANTNWSVFDSMRGIPTGTSDAILHPNSPNAESAPVNFIDLTSTGFKVQTTQHDDTNQSGDVFLYIAIRRPDGLVGKPPEAGTDVFAMDYGNSSSSIPTFDSGFPVDFALLKRPTATSNFLAQSRLSGDHYLFTNDNQAEVSHSAFICWDSNVGWAKSWDSDRFSWMFKRHAGFDVVTYKGSGSADYVYHSLGKIPEMIWVKKRSGSGDWRVYHKALGTSNDPYDYSLKLNGTDTQIDDATVWNDAAPEINRFTIGTHADVNTTGSTYLSILFASVSGISKVGYYAGNSSGQTITTGFQPRFVIIKGIDYGASWYVLDTVRGWSAGNDQSLEINTTQAQNTGDFGAPTSTGFTLTGHNVYNGTGYNYIYYAHA